MEKLLNLSFPSNSQEFLFSSVSKKKESGFHSRSLLSWDKNRPLLRARVTRYPVEIYRFFTGMRMTFSTGSRPLFLTNRATGHVFRIVSANRSKNRLFPKTSDGVQTILPIGNGAQPARVPSIFLVSLRFLEIFFFQNFFFYSFSIVSRIKIIISITRSVVASSRLALSDYATASSLSLSRICLRNRLITGRNDRFSLTFFRALREFRTDARAN